MLKRIWAVMQKEFIHTLRDRSTLLLLLVLPMIQLFLYGYAVDINVDHIPMVVCDQSLDSQSRAYVEAMVASTYFDVAGYVTNQDDVIAAIDRGDANAGVVIPADFAEAVERREAQVLFLIDGSDLFTVQSAYGVADTIAQAHAADVLMEKIERAGLPFEAESPLDAHVRVLYNPRMEQLWFLIPGLAAMLLQTQSIAMTAAAVVREREVGTMEQLLVTPIRPGELLLGKTAPNIVIAIVNMLTIIGAGVFIFDVPFRGSFALFVTLSLVYVFSGLGLGLLVSTVSKNLRQAQQLVMLLLMLGVILSGFMFPRYTMPPVLRFAGNLFPMTYFIPIARGLITKGVGIDAIWRQTVSLAVYSVAVIVVATLVFRRELG